MAAIRSRGRWVLISKQAAQHICTSYDVSYEKRDIQLNVKYIEYGVMVSERSLGLDNIMLASLVKRKITITPRTCHGANPVDVAIENNECNKMTFTSHRKATVNLNGLYIQINLWLIWREITLFRISVIISRLFLVNKSLPSQFWSQICCLFAT